MAGDDHKELVETLDEALDLLEGHFGEHPPRGGFGDESLPTLLEQAFQRYKQEREAEPIRLVQQFACTGGTLFCKGLQAQPNTLVLSEVDPFSLAHRERVKPAFSPTDLIALADINVQPLSEDTKREMFLASLSVLHKRLQHEGRRLVVREHSHSQFCATPDWTKRPMVREVIEESFPVKSVVFIRHPLDSWLSLVEHGWNDFSPFNIEEYARRYIAFLDCNDKAPLIKYEDFARNPNTVMELVCEHLDLVVNPDWESLLPVIKLTGDSGRKGSKIVQRPRRAISDEVRAEAEKSKNYNALCARLEYEANPSSK